MLAFMDETACQSVTNVRRVLYPPNSKNIQVHCGEKFKINVLLIKPFLTVLAV